MYAQRQTRSFVIGHGHLPGLGLDFITQRRNGFNHTRTGAVRTWLAQHPLKRLFGALARDAHKAELVERQRFRRCLILLERQLQRRQHLLPVTPLFHVDEVHYDYATQVAQPNLPHYFPHRLEVGLHNRVFQTRGAFAHELAGVHVDRDQRLRVIDHDIPARFQPNLRAQSLIEFVLYSELFEDRLFLRIQLDLAHQLRLEPAYEFHHLAEFFFAVDPNSGEVITHVIAQDA